MKVVVMDIINAMYNGADWYVNPNYSNFILYDVWIWKQNMLYAIFGGDI